ncbi:outer membrane beta-barrel protein [Xanthobacter sp. 91]|uniref:outer membrane beta-barrel protein n=1 Tax=Xanthobacter sp. 91 TaxID=1117244 RepID=UPI00069132CD|nr:outer membrane beta-barrel protein [Xanthobacter sp. 91]
MGLRAALAMLVAGAMLAMAPARPAHAADLSAAPAPQPQAASGWQYQATLYLWATGIDGDIGIRRLPAIPVDITFGDVMQNFQGAVMGNFIAKKDNWTLFADVFWSQLGTSKNLSTAGQPLVDFSQRLFILSGAAGYRLPVGDSDFDLSATAGFRYQRLSANTSLSSIFVPFAISESDSKDWLDPTFGLALQWKLNKQWFLNALADVGGFGLPASSKLSAQGLVAVGYNWNESWSTALGYRALYTDYESITSPTRDFRYNTTMHGPFMSIGYHF